MQEIGDSAPSGVLRADRLVVIAAALLIVAIAALALGLFGLAEIQEGGARGAAQVRALRAAGGEISQAAADYVSSEHAFLLTRDQAYRDPRARAAVEAATRHITTLTAADRQLAAPGARLAASASALLSEDQTRPANAAESRSAARLLIEKTDQFQADAQRLQNAVEMRAGRLRAQSAKARASGYWIGGVLVVVALLAACIALWAIRAERRSWRDALAVMVRANREAEVAREKAAASDLAKTRFLAAASHDMRQPLHALTLYLSALERRIDGEEARGILTKAERAAQSMVGMFNTLLDLARIQADVVQPDHQVFALQELLERIIGEHPNAKLAGPSPPTQLDVYSDPVLLERLLRNLISNALRHGGGAARITVERKPECAEIAVIDDGPGIAEEDQGRIFNEFVRLDGRAGGEGLGLGLAIVKRIAELLRLDIRLQSTPGKGAAFIVCVPIAHAAAAPQTSSAGADAAAGLDILAMDDDPLALEAEVGVLRDLGAHVRACASEADVNAALDQGFTPRLLMMDLRIDGVLAGVDIANRARARLTPPPPVIMVTGDTAPETLTFLRRSGYAWLIKPVSRDDLIAALAAARARVDA